MKATRLRVRVLRGAAPGERGAANHDLVALAALRLAVDRRDLTLVSGRASRDKILDAAGGPPAETEARRASAGRKDA